MKKTNYIGAKKTNEAGKKYIEPIDPQAGILKAIADKLLGKTGTSATCRTRYSIVGKERKNLCC